MTKTSSALLSPFSDVEQTIRKRYSCRNYLDEAPDAALLGRLEQQLASAPPAPFGNPVRMKLIDKRGEQMPHLGTYGVIKGARYYLGGAVQDTDMALEDFGYLFEWAILLATELGLGSCWLGGTLTRDAFASSLAAAPGDLVPCVSPVGLPASSRTQIDRVFRGFAGSSKRKPWSEIFFDGSFQKPLDETAAGPLGRPLESLRWGPSASNAQPWRVLRDDQGTLHFHVHRSPAHGLFNSVDLPRVDLGIALCHFECAARHAGFEGRFVRGEAPIPEHDLPKHTHYVASWR